MYNFFLSWFIQMQVGSLKCAFLSSFSQFFASFSFCHSPTSRKEWKHVLCMNCSSSMKKEKKIMQYFFLHKRVIMAWKWGVIVTMLRKKRHFIDKKRTICIWRELIDEDINQSVHQKRRKWEKIIYWRKNTISFSCFIHRVLLDEG